MCANYTPTRNDNWTRAHLGVPLPAGVLASTVFPGNLAPIARHDERGATTCRLARFGLIPHWAKDATIGRRTYNARTETVSAKPSYRTPWRKRQRAIALLDAFFEPNWESGRAVRWRVQRADGEPMGVASLWDRWQDPASGAVVESFTMLTVNADGHPLMGRFHRPGDEKRSVAVLEPAQFEAWLSAPSERAASLCLPPASALLVGEPEAPSRSTGRSLFD